MANTNPEGGALPRAPRSSQKVRMIEQIRRAFPDVSWVYRYPSTYEASDGRSITGYSILDGFSGEHGYTSWRILDPKRNTQIEVGTGGHIFGLSWLVEPDCPTESQDRPPKASP